MMYHDSVWQREKILDEMKIFSKVLKKEKNSSHKHLPQEKMVYIYSAWQSGKIPDKIKVKLEISWNLIPET